MNVIHIYTMIISLIYKSLNVRIFKKPIIKLGPRVNTKRTAYTFFLFKKILISKVIKIFK